MKWTVLLLGIVKAAIIDLTEENQGLLGGHQIVIRALESNNMIVS